MSRRGRPKELLVTIVIQHHAVPIQRSSQIKGVEYSKGSSDESVIM